MPPEGDSEREWLRTAYAAALVHGLFAQGTLHGAGRVAAACPVSDDERDAFHLANQLIVLDAELRDRQWRALERLLALIPPHGGELRDVLHLPRPQMAQAVRAWMGCGWWSEAPESDEDPE